MIIYNNNYIGAYEKAEEKLTSHYNKVNKQNKGYSNPQGHILDKYMDSHASGYRSDMTQRQREIAMKNESDMLRYGKLTAVYYEDYMLKDDEPVNSAAEIAKEKQYNIDAVNEQITQLLGENGIKINKDQDFTFSIDPYNYKLRVSGSEDKELMQQIEDVLNTGKNTENLFYHVFTRYMEVGEVDEEAYNKFQAYKEVKNHTGYDLSKLENKDGKFITKEGIDIIDIYNNSIRKAPYMSDKQKRDVSTYYDSIISKVAKKGWDNISDLGMNIKFKDGILYRR